MCNNAPHTCGRISCSYDAAIWYCNVRVHPVPIFSLSLFLLPSYRRFPSMYFCVPLATSPSRFLLTSYVYYEFRTKISTCRRDATAWATSALKAFVSAATAGRSTAGPAVRSASSASSTASPSATRPSIARLFREVWWWLVNKADRMGRSCILPGYGEIPRGFATLS